MTATSLTEVKTSEVGTNISLKQINTSNVASLKEAWTFPMTGGGTSVPLVVNGVMYLTGRRVVAHDAHVQGFE